MKNKLKEIRMKEYGMEPIEFATLLEANVKTYYAWELGNVLPSMKKSLEISKKLNRTVNEIWYLE